MSGPDRLDHMFEIKDQTNHVFGSPTLEQAQSLSLEVRCGIVQKHLFHLIGEIMELGKACGSNYWKMGQILDEAAIREEFADCLHVLLSSGVILGLGPEEVYQAYLAKAKKNKTRQDWLANSATTEQK